MNISFFIGGLSGGGAERVTCNLANYFAERDNKVTIFTMADDEPSYYLNSNIERISLLCENERSSFAVNSIKRTWRFIHYLRKKHFDVIVGMLPVTIFLLIAFRKFTTAKVYAAERNSPESYNFLICCLLKLFAKHADGWVFQTKEAQGFYIKYVKNFRIIPNAVNLDFLDSNYNGYDSLNLISIGRLNYQKNHLLIIRSFNEVLKDYPNLKLYIYGDGPLRKRLEEEVRDLSIEKSVFLPGYVSDIKAILQSSRIFILSSDWEGIPNALIEALAVGIPCISTDCDGGGAKLLINNNENGILVPKNDVQSLTRAIKTLIADKNMSFKFNEKSKTTSSRFSPDNIYAQWYEFLVK